MVSSIVPGHGAGALALEPRLARGPGLEGAVRRDEAAQGDRVEVSGASLAIARESVRAAVQQLHQVLALGQDAQAMLVKVQALSRNGGEQPELDATLSAFSERVAAVIAQGASLAAGEDVLVQAEPGASPVSIAGADLRLKDEPSLADIIKVPADANLKDHTLGQAVQRSLEALQDAMARLLDSARALDAHNGFLGAAEGAVAGNVRGDINADGARLLALQVRQGLEAMGGQSIANVEPQAVLALFRA